MSFELYPDPHNLEKRTNGELAILSAMNRLESVMPGLHQKAARFTGAPRGGIGDSVTLALLNDEKGSDVVFSYPCAIERMQNVAAREGLSVTPFYFYVSEYLRQLKIPGKDRIWDARRLSKFMSDLTRKTEVTEPTIDIIEVGNRSAHTSELFLAPFDPTAGKSTRIPITLEEAAKPMGEAGNIFDRVLRVSEKIVTVCSIIDE